ncbi:MULTISPECIES: ATP-binding protein, partial [unclassified Caballeronia]
MMMHQTLTQLRTLKLDGFADGLEEQLTQPGTAALSFEERLSLLVDREASWRDDRRRTRLLKQARLKYP